MKYKISAFICLLISIINLSVLKVDAFKEVILFSPDPVTDDIFVNFYDETGDSLLFKFSAYSGNNPTLKFTSGMTSVDGIYCTGGTFSFDNKTSLCTFISTRISYIQDCEIVVPLGFPSFSPDLFYISSSNTLTYNTHFFSDTNFYVKFAENPNAPSGYRLLTNADMGKKIGVDFEKNIWLDKSLNASGIFHNSMLMFNATSVSTKACMLDYGATSFSFRDRSAEEPEYFIKSSTWQNFTNPTWYSRSDGSGTEYLIACYESDDNYVNNVVYVKEKISSYNVTYNAFTTDSFGETIYTGTAPTNLIGVANLPDTLPVLTQNGYIFDSWYYDSAYETLAVPGAALTSNVSLYAKWSIANYTISYYDTNGVTQFNNLSPTTYVMADRTITLPIPIKNGYSFFGWYDIDLENIILSIAPMSYGNLSLYAKWQSTTYNITYYDGSTQLNLSPTTYDYTVGATLPTPTKTGYTFIGWRYDHGNGETGYTDITNISANPSGIPNPIDYTLYAQWQENTYTITYYDETNVLTGLSPSSYSFNHSAITLPTPTKANYLFDGWYTDNTFITRVNALLSVDYGNKSYYSKWVEQAYTITYFDGTTVLINLQPQIYSYVHDLIILPTITKPNAVFAGWYSDSSLTEKVNALLSVDYGNKTFYAKWEVDFINEINRTIYKNPNSVLTTADVVSILKDNISIYGNNYSLEVVNDAYTGHGNVLGTYTINFNLKRNNISVRNFDFNVVVNDNITCRYYYNKTFYIGSEDEFTYADYISILRYLEDLPNAEINYTIVSALRTDITKDYFALEKKANGVYESIINYTSTAGYNGSRRYLLNVFETAPYSIVEKKDYTFTSGEKALIIAVFLGFVIGGVIIYNKVIKPKIGKKNKSGYDVTYVYNPNNKKGGNFKK